MIPSDTDYARIVKKIRDDIYNIDVPIPHALKNFNLYLLLGDEPTLIDTGPYNPAFEDIIVTALRQLRVDRLSRILITHSHIDHSGMASRLRDLTGAQVIAHRAERPRIESPKQRLTKEYRCYSLMSLAMGFPEDISHSIFGLAQGWVSLSQPCVLDVALKGGETIRAGDRELKAIHTPGHTAGHLCFYETGEGLLFSGDHLMRSITPNPELYCPPRYGHVTGLTQFLESLRRLERYDAVCAYPGHGKPIKQVEKRIEFNILHHQRRLEKTERAVNEGCRTVWEVALRLFPQVRGISPDIDHFLALKEALGHLVILEDSGVVKRADEGDLWRYIPA
jgi:glyoxylase-like metal-dependent hydrolase (beta-lactamase superfamily II)